MQVETMGYLNICWTVCFIHVFCTHREAN